jgi:glutaredoxin
VFIDPMNLQKKRNPEGRSSVTTYFFIVSVLGALYLFVEAGLQVVGRSVCVAGGCGLVARLARFGDLPMILMGGVALAFLASLSGLNRRRRSGLVDSAINLALIAALAAEGFLVGYQVFWLPELCPLCLSVFGILFLLGLLRLAAGWKEAGAGFLAFAVVLCFVGIVLPPRGPALPADKKMILFYSPDCPHCSEIKEAIAKTNLNITPVLVKEYTETLKNLGVDSVPTLFVNGRYEKLILTGKEAIGRYLAACQTSGIAPAAVPGARSSNKGASNRSGDSGALLPVLPLSPWGAANQAFNPAGDEGVCKEEQKCE